jgi:hypothetical protein
VPSFVSALAAEGEAWTDNRAHHLALIEQLRAIEARTEATSAKSAPGFAQSGAFLAF